MLHHYNLKRDGGHLVPSKARSDGAAERWRRACEVWCTCRPESKAREKWACTRDNTVALCPACHKVLERERRANRPLPFELTRAPGHAVAVRVSACTCQTCRDGVPVPWWDGDEVADGDA